jgi:ketosteroid isomerase-like protein
VRRGDMSADKNIELVQAGYAAFSTGDMATLNDLFAAAAVWHVPGSGVMSGPKGGMRSWPISVRLWRARTELSP